MLNVKLKLKLKRFSPTIDIPFNLDLALSILVPLPSLSVTFQECKHTTAFYYFLSQQITLSPNIERFFIRLKNEIFNTFGIRILGVEYFANQILNSETARHTRTISLDDNDPWIHNSSIIHWREYSASENQDGLSF